MTSSESAKSSRLAESSQNQNLLSSVFGLGTFFIAVLPAGPVKKSIKKEQSHG